MAKDVSMMEVLHTLVTLFLGMLYKFIFPYMEKVHLTTLWPAVKSVFLKQTKQNNIASLLGEK